MNTEAFTGKAEAYANARPEYPVEAMEYIKTLAPASSVFVDIGAETGKFTVSLARYGYEIYAVEPNADMRGQLAEVLKLFSNVRIIDGAAESSNIPDHSIDVITCAQALHWFDLEAFKAECRRIGKPNALVIAVCNIAPNGSLII